MTKNKLEEEFFQYLKSIDRNWVENEKGKELMQDILKTYGQLCKKHHRCKPLEKFFSSSHEEKGDFILYGSNATFKLLKTK